MGVSKMRPPSPFAGTGSSSADRKDTSTTTSLLYIAASSAHQCSSPSASCICTPQHQPSPLSTQLLNSTITDRRLLHGRVSTVHVPAREHLLRILAIWHRGILAWHAGRRVHARLHRVRIHAIVLRHLLCWWWVHACLLLHASLCHAWCLCSVLCASRAALCRFFAGYDVDEEVEHV